jgi:hypothetical protein
MDYDILYIIRNFLERRCLKWARIIHLDIWNTSYGEKKGQKNCQFDSQPLKVENHPNFLACRWRATYHWKALDNNYNFTLDFILIEGLHTKLWGSKVAGLPTLTVLGLPLGSPGTKSHLDVGPMERHRVYYKGEGGGFPQVWATVSLMCPCCPWFVLAPRMLQLCTNHFVWVVCRPMWVSEACQLFLVPSRSSNMPFYPSKCCELRSVPQLRPFLLSFTWVHIWVPQGVGSVSIMVLELSPCCPIDLPPCYPITYEHVNLLKQKMNEYITITWRQKIANLGELSILKVFVCLWL